jgi:hypothetical protein
MEKFENFANSKTTSREKLHLKLEDGSILPDTGSKTLRLITATSAEVSPKNISGCELTVKNFASSTNVDGKIQIEFTLIGADGMTTASPRDARPAGCLVKLSTMAITGFSADFENVRVGGTLSTATIPKVRLEVSASTAQEM